MLVQNPGSFWCLGGYHLFFDNELLCKSSSNSAAVSKFIPSQDAAAAWSGDLAQRIIATRVFDFLDHSLCQNAKVFNKAPQVYQEVSEHDNNDNILMLHELAGKLIDVIREAKKDGDMGEDIHVTRHNKITAEAERVFFEAVKAGEDNIRRARGRHNDSGKDEEAEMVFVEAVKAGEDNTRRARRRHDDSGKEVLFL